MLKKGFYLFSIVLVIIALLSCPPAPVSPPDVGAFWFQPVSITTANNTNFSMEVHFNSGTRKISTYGIDIIYSAASLSLNGDLASNGVSAGAEGFIAAINAKTAGTLNVTGFDITGKGPGTDLHMLTLYFTAVKSGTVAVTSAPISATDDASTDFQPLTGSSCRVTIK